MASYSFAGSNGAGWGGSGLGSWGMLGPAIYNSTLQGLKLENALYDMQNRVALDPYAINAAAAKANAVREQSGFDAMKYHAGQDMISAKTGEQPGMSGNRAVTTAPSPATTQFGDPANAQWLLNNAAANAIAPSTGVFDAPMHGTLGYSLTDPTLDWLFGGM